MLTADELLAGSALTHEVSVPPELLGPAAPADGRVRLRPLTVRDLTLISRAARENDQLLSALMVQAALDEPRLTLAQVNALPVGLLEFLLREVNRISGITLPDGVLAQAAADPLVRAAHLLSAEFGWTPEEIAGLTLGQMLVHLELIRSGAMPAPEAAAPARAVREVLGALQAPALRGALMIEGALAGVLAALVQAPLAATFDPLARPAGAAAPARAAPSGSRSARQRRAGTAGTAPAAAPRNAGPAGASAAGAGTGLGAALGGAPATDAQRTDAVLGGIAAAVAALTGPARPAARTPDPAAATARGTVLAAAGMTGAAMRTAGRALDVVPGASAVAPVLGGIGALADALWWRVALTPPAADASQPQTASPAPRRSPRPSAGAPAARAGGNGGAELLPAQAQAALGTLGEIVVALYGQVARAGAAQTPPGQRPTPAPRAPSVLVGPGGAATPASREASTPAAPPDSSRPAGAPGTPGVAISVDADALARALRAEGLLRGVDL